MYRRVESCVFFEGATSAFEHYRTWNWCLNTLLIIFLDIFILREHRVWFVLNLNSFSICWWLVILTFDFNWNDIYKKTNISKSITFDMILKSTYSARRNNFKRLSRNDIRYEAREAIRSYAIDGWAHSIGRGNGSEGVFQNFTNLYRLVRHKLYRRRYCRIRALYRMILYKIRFSLRFNLHGTIQYSSVSSNGTKLTKTVRVTRWYHFRGLPKNRTISVTKLVSPSVGHICVPRGENLSERAFWNRTNVW